ncbi:MULTISPECIES: hypothetical protein [unclassified Sphingomonas]|uniref:hypothetical protein n=1 Tax=unclassified Sphingomonas TaxID=196159 RepID=UPI002ED77242
MGIYQIITPTDRGHSAPNAATGFAGSEADALEAALADMTATFSANFVDGRVGERHNTYEHRSRVLRQMAGRLALMRARDAAATS